jgi:hypothetical protein
MAGADVPRRCARDDRVAFRGPELATDPPTLEAIYRLRAAVWSQTAGTSQTAFRDGRWSDEHDPAGTHRVFRHGDEVVAAGRQSLHDRLADVPEAEAYAAAGLELRGRIAAPAHLVVAVAARRRVLVLRVPVLACHDADAGAPRLARGRSGSPR